MGRNILALAVGLLSAAPAFGQAMPAFIGGPATAFDTQVSVVESGALLDASAVVSQDRRYVTITAQPSNTSLLALQQFHTQTISVLGSGFVGGVDPTGSGTIPPATDKQSSEAIDRAVRNAKSVLNQHGVYLLAPLK